MTDQEMFDWYKNGAVKTESMSDQDYEVYKNKALYAQKNQLLDSNLATQQAGLAKAQTNAQQSASINNDKLMKYLGQKQLSSGIATGQTGSDFINANNAYTQNRASIANNFAAQQNDLLQRYAGEKLQVGSDAFKDEMDILDKYYGRNYQAERDAITDNWYADEVAHNRAQDAWQKDLTLEQWANTKKQQEYDNATTAQDKAYANVMTSLSEGMFNSAEEFSALVEYMQPYLSEQDYRYFKENAKSIYDNSEAEAKENTAKWESYSANFSGAQYKGSNPTVGDDGVLSVKVEGKTMYAYEQLSVDEVKKDGRSGETAKWIEACQRGEVPNGAVMDVIPGNTNKHVMYYNGKFYLIGDQTKKVKVSVN